MSAESSEPAPGRARRFRAAWQRYRDVPALAALFLVILGAHLWTVATYSRPLPFWDQWDGEWQAVLKPWLEGRLRFADLFHPHNEHRIVLTRVTDLALFAANGQWDGYVEMAANALFYAGACTAVAAGLLRVFGPVYRPGILLAAGLLGVLPYGYENTLCGFQSQGYYLTFLSLAALWGVGFRRPGGWGWWTGLLCAALALLTMGSGFLAAVAAGTLLGWRCLAARRGPTRGEAAAAAWCVAVAAVGWFTRVDVPWHAGYKAESVAAFVAAAGRFAAWPCDGTAWLGLVTQAPLLLLAARAGRRLAHAPRAAAGEGRAVELLLAVGLWLALQIAALAYARGGHGGGPASRYMDLLATGLLVNFLALLWTVVRTRRSAWRWVVLPGGAGWLFFVAYSLCTLSIFCFRQGLPDWEQRSVVSEEKVRGYVAVGDIAWAFGDRKDLPYPDADRLAAMLDDPLLKAVLPPDVRLPLALEAVAGGDDDGKIFVPMGVPRPNPGPAPQGSDCWGSFNEQGEAARGTARWRVAGEVRGAYLHFFVASSLPTMGLTLQVRDPVSGQTVRDWPEQDAREGWADEYVRSPGRHLEIMADDRSDTAWFAFTEPVEVGWLSYWTNRFLQGGAGIFTAGVVLACGLVTLSWLGKLPAETGGVSAV